MIYLQREMSGDTCLCPASGAKPKLSGFKGGGLGNKYVQLNVGGSLYYTTVRALTRHDTMLKAMFSGRMEVLTDKEGEARGLVWRDGDGRWEKEVTSEHSLSLADLESRFIFLLHLVWDSFTWSSCAASEISETVHGMLCVYIFFREKSCTF